MEEIISPQIKTISETEDYGVFVIEPLFPGYGHSLANPLRRVLLSSIEGAAVSYVKIEGASHEFSTLPGVKEDVLEIIMNLKQLRVKLLGDEPVKMRLDVKGPKEVKASLIKAPSQVEIINKDLYIATLDGPKSTLSIEMTVEKGRGYVPVEEKPERQDIGVIEVDSLFSPILGVNFKIENTRVGQRTDFDKIILEIKTDGTITPSEALKRAAEILVDQFKLISEVVPHSSEKKAKKEPKGKAAEKEEEKEGKNDEKVAKKKRSKKSSA